MREDQTCSSSLPAAVACTVHLRQVTLQTTQGALVTALQLWYRAEAALEERVDAQRLRKAASAARGSSFWMRMTPKPASTPKRLGSKASTRQAIQRHGSAA